MPAPVYEYKMVFLYLNFSNEWINEFTEMEQKIYDLIRLEPQVRQSDLAVRLNLTEQYVRKIIKRLKDIGFIERFRARKNGYWIVKPGE